MNAKKWKILGYLIIVVFILLFFLLDEDHYMHDSGFIWIIPIFSVLFFQKSKLESLELDLIKGEVIDSCIKQSFAAWAIWKTNKRLVIYWPTGPKKGLSKFFTSMVTEGKNPEKNKNEPLGYFLQNSTNLDEFFNKETGYVSLNLEEIEEVEAHKEKLGIKKHSVRKIKLKDKKTIICLHLGVIGGGKKAYKLLDTIN